MKFLHLSDLHIGKSLNGFSLIEDQEYILGELLKLIETERADAVLIAGDVYDRSVPSEEAVRLLDRFLGNLAKMSVPTFLISGNHDSDERLNFGSGLFCSAGIYISAKYEGKLTRVVLKDESGPLNVWLMPFIKASVAAHFHPGDKIESYDDAVRAVVRHSGLDPRERNILVAHQFVTGDGKDPESGGSESVSAAEVGTVERVHYTCFDDFDYVALGHIHSAQPVGREQVRYAGSPLKYSVSEANRDKSVTFVTVGEKGDISVKPVPLVPMRDLRHLKGPLDELTAEEHVTSPDDYIYATLTDEEPVPDARAILKKIYPNLVRMDFENSRTHELERTDLPGIEGNQKSFSEIVSEFYQTIYQRDISEEELSLMLEVAKKGGLQA